MTTKKTKKRIYQNFSDYHLKKLQDPQEARTYLAVALEDYEKDGDREVFLLALRDVAEAYGGMRKLARDTQLNRQNLYKVLSKEGNPRLETVGAILQTLGFRLSVELR